MPPCSSLRARSPLFVLAVVVAGGGWLGCATNGEVATEDPTVTTPVPTAKSDGGVRPDFEAGFVDADAGPQVPPAPDGGGAPCVDVADPGGAENTAMALPDTSDAQNTALTVQGIAKGPADVDFYKLHVADQVGHLLEPALQLATSGVEMCVFVRCDQNGATTVTCPSPSVATKSALGTDGCCGSGASAVSPIWNCATTNDSAELLLRIQQTGSSACLPYSFSYAF